MKKTVLLFALCFAAGATLSQAVAAEQSPLAATFHAALTAAQGGDASAQNSLGEIYEDGRGVGRSNEQAAVWYCKAAGQGNANAQYHLGLLSGRPKTKGIRGDPAQALAWLRKSAEQGNPQAQFMLASLYERGERGFVEEDQEQASLWYGKAIGGFRKAADRGDADALFALAQAYEKGYGVARDGAQAAKLHDEALTILRKAADQGDVAAQVTLGEIYDYGSDAMRDEKQSIMWYSKAAEQGAVDAQYHLGEIYARASDSAQAAVWYRKAAEQGDDEAQYRLGIMYLDGDGVTQDKTQVVAWLRKSASQGNTYAWNALKNSGADVSDLPKLRPAQPLPCAVQADASSPTVRAVENSGQSACAISRYRQEKFNRENAFTEFQDFRLRLRRGFEAFGGMISGEDEADTMARLHTAFADSVSTGAKGDVLLASFVQSSGGRVVPPMQTMLNLVLNKACPVGFGGSFVDDGHQVELWYVDLTPGSDAEVDDVMRAFRAPALPAYGSLKRDAFPALVFERDPQGRLKWYGVSREMATILDYWFNIQIM